MQVDDATTRKGTDPAGTTESSTGTSSGAPAKKIAVIVVHGVADQKPGATAQAFVDLMVTSSNGDVRYEVDGGAQDLVLSVEPMSPDLPFSFERPVASSTSASTYRDLGAATPSGRDRSFIKSLAQSVKSDFQRQSEGDGPNVKLDWSWLAAHMRFRLKHPFTPTPLLKGAETVDRGLRYTNYLLGKAIRNDAPPEGYATRRIGMQRVVGDESQQVDVHEMYWADLSRLSSAVPSIVTEVFTMIFRLSRLGRDTVDEASRHADSNVPRRRRTWALLSGLQTVIDWMFTNVLAQLFAHLLLVGLIIIALGFFAPKVGPQGLSSAWTLNTVNTCRQHVEDADLCDRKAPTKTADEDTGPWKAVGAALGLAAFAVVAYFAINTSRRGAMLLAGLVVALAALIAHWPPIGVGLTLLVFVTAVYLAAMRSADDRFPFIFIAGSTIWACIVAASVLSRPLGAHHTIWPPTDWDLAIETALSGFEITLFLIKWWWIVMAVPILLWIVTTTVVTVREWIKGRYEARASAATGRLGLLMAFSSFLIIAMALWAGLQTPVKLAVADRAYEPMLSWTGSKSAPVANPDADGPAKSGYFMTCNDAPGARQNAAQFVECRFESSTSTASLIAFVLLLVILYLVVTVVPSVLAELRFVTSDRQEEARRLGRWLTWFYRHVDRILLLLTIVGGLAATIVGVAFFSGIHTDEYSLFLWFADRSVQLLHWFVIPTASLFAALSLFGRFVSRNIPGLRAPLDAALDVDNHLREFPRHQIPRARIFARYRALLDHICREEYERIVVVSHSQGTVISAEFLRFIASESFEFHREDRAPRLREVLGRDLHLLTFGCPLRQLYAARFPTLYRWILDTSRTPSGPRAGDVGARRWFNAFGSGDYVGRWLWSHHDQATHFHPLNDAVWSPALGRETAYDLFRPITPKPDALQARELETCVGFQAHTHYLDLPRSRDETSIVAMLADRLMT